MSLTPIARWDTVPYQRINSGEYIDVGVVAFSKAGINRVEFTVTGQGYSSGVKTAGSMSLNSQTDVWEYNVRVSASSFTSDGQITVGAVVYGSDGGTRDCGTISLTVNPTGTLPQYRAWVSTTGNDGTGVVEDISHPYATIGAAATALRAYRNSHGFGQTLDACRIIALPGTHTMSSWNVYTTSTEWLVLEGAGDDPEDTIITPGESVTTTLYKFTNLRLSGARVVGEVGTYTWVDNCEIVGSGRWTSSSNAVGFATSVYYTDCDITASDFGAPCAILARGLNIHSIGNDAFQNCQLVINCVADDIDPGATGWHSDAWQHHSGTNDDNSIVYNYRATDLNYHGLFFRAASASNTHPPPASGMAFVNMYLEMSDGHIAEAGYSSWYVGVDHLIWWNCEFRNHMLNIYPDFWTPGDYTYAVITNFSAIGNVFYALTDSNPDDTDIDYTGWVSNHFEIPSGQVDYQTVYTAGTDISTGDTDIDTAGMPTAESCLVERITPPPVPIDVYNNYRGSDGDVGPMEYSTESYAGTRIVLGVMR